MVVRWRRRPHPNHALGTVRVHLQQLEDLVASIADLTTAVTGLTDVEQKVLAALGNPAGGTVLSAADQSALDAAVAQVNTVAGNLTAALPAPAPAPVTPADVPADVPAGNPNDPNSPTI